MVAHRLRLKKNSILWILLAYSLFYCFDPALFPQNISNINSVIIIALVIILMFRNGIKRRDSTWICIYICYVIYILLQTLSSELVESVLSVYKLYIIYPTLAFLGIIISYSFFYDTTKAQCRIWKLLWCWGLVLFALGLYEAFTGQYIISISSALQETMDSYSAANSGIVRVMVFAKSFLLLGDLFGILSVTSFCLYIKFKNKIYLITIFIFLIGTFLGASRGSLVGTIFGLFIMWLLHRNPLTMKTTVKKIVNVCKWIFVIVLVLTVIIKFSQTNEVIAYWTDRITTIFNWSTDSTNTLRMEHWGTFLSIWMSSPKIFFFGTGGITAGLLSTVYSVTESGFIQHLVEIGLIGSAFYYVLMLFPFIRYLKFKNKTNFGNWVISSFIILFVHDFVLQISAEDFICVLMWLFVLLMIVENRRISKLGDKIATEKFVP